MEDGVGGEASGRKRWSFSRGATARLFFMLLYEQKQGFCSLLKAGASRQDAAWDAGNGMMWAPVVQEGEFEGGDLALKDE